MASWGPQKHNAPHGRLDTAWALAQGPLERAWPQPKQPPVSPELFQTAAARPWRWVWVLHGVTWPWASRTGSACVCCRGAGAGTGPFALRRAEAAPQQPWRLEEL